MYRKNIDLSHTHLYILLTYKVKNLHFREACPKGENFDEVRKATEGSACGCEGDKKLNKTKTYITKYSYLDISTSSFAFTFLYLIHLLPCI